MSAGGRRVLVALAAALLAATPAPASAVDGAVPPSVPDNVLPAELERVLPAAPAKEAPAPAADNAATPAGGYRLLESTVASANGEVVFLSDVVREACCYSCGAFPGDPPVPTTLATARERYIADILVLQEQRKLGLGEVDNAVLRDAVVEARARMGRCRLPCAARIEPTGLDEYVARRMLVRDFLAKRVSVFVEVTDEEVQAEVGRRRDRAPRGAPEVREEDVRRDMVRERTEREIRNWFSRAASKARIVLSPLEEK